MNDITVIILAAGQGTRLGVLGKQLPKALIRTGNDSETLISRLIDQFSTITNDIRVVTGHHKDILAPYLCHKYPNLIIGYNPYYNTKSNKESLIVGLHKIGLKKISRTIIIDADTYLSDSAFDYIKGKVMTSLSSIIFTTKQKRPEGEWSIITDSSDRVIGVSTSPSIEDCITSGVNYFSAKDICHIINYLYAEKDYDYWDDIYRLHYSELDLKSYEIPGFLAEVDSLDDIQILIERSR